MRINRGGIEIPDDEAGDVIAIAGNYSRVLASRRRGTLTVREADDGLEVLIADEVFQATEAGRELQQIADVAPVLVRPVFRQEESEFRAEGDTAVFSRMRLRALLVGVTDDDDGAWPPVTFGGDERAAPKIERPKPRVWL